MGELKAIWSKRTKKGPMDPLISATLTKKEGMVGDANRGPKRQITLIEEEKWQAMMAETGGDVPPTTRRANLMISGVDLENSRHRLLQIGMCRIYIWGETRPCNRMEEALPGLQAAMSKNWRGGVYGEVVDEGEISVGDQVAWADEHAPVGRRAL